MSFAQPENFGDLDSKLPNCAFGTAFRDEPPSLERVADAGKVLRHASVNRRADLLSRFD